METTNNIFTPSILHESTSGATQLSLSSELFRSRKLFLIGDVNAESMGTLMQELMILDAESNEPIDLFINSVGGMVTSGIAVYRYMTEVMRSPIHTYCIGFAASMAAVLYLAGSKRFVYEGTKIVIHDPFSIAPSSEKPDELKDRLTSLEKTKDMICQIISDITEHPFDEISKIIKTDKIYDANEALEFGLATNIIKKETTNYHNNPFVSRPDGSHDTNRGLPPPIERYQEESAWKPNPGDIIIPAVPKSLLHLKRKDNTTVFRFGFSYRFSDDGRPVYANTDILPSQTKFDNYKYNLNLGAADKTYDCELSDGSGTVTMTALEIGKLFKEIRDKYLAKRARRSILSIR